MYRFCIIIFFVLASFSCSDNEIQGDWISENPERTSTGSYGIREFSFRNGTWEIRYTVYLDSIRQRPVFTFRGIGKYKVGERSKVISEAHEAVFHFDKKFVTLKINDTTLVRKFGLQQCNLMYNVEKDISETGCSYLVSKASCAQEYDLVSRLGEKLFLGARPASGGMCDKSKRPQALGFPLKKLK